MEIKEQRKELDYKELRKQLRAILNGCNVRDIRSVLDDIEKEIDSFSTYVVENTDLLPTNEKKSFTLS